MPAPPIIHELVERFAQHRDAYQSTSYNETQLRREFLDPFFKALGWDVDNEAGHAEAYKDVIHEDAIKVGGATKAPDYCFRIGGRRIFFLEAKKPAIDVKHDDNPAFQLRRYAWSAKLPLSILSDFEEFAVYDCRLKPNQRDKAAIGRTLFLTFEQYIDKWDEIAGIFSKQAVQKGSFDKYAESGRRKRGTAEVDAAFLTEIESWRDVLARNLALRNDDLNQRDLNFAVQRTIDRIIFLRMCEDRGVEPYGQLMGLLNGERVCRRLRELFERADERYNSGLFHFHAEKGRVEPPDELTPALSLDDKPLKDIIRGLYYPESPYEFSVLPAEILGQVYEQFLGKVIRLTPAHKAVVEDKPEVKKAGGVYYTPAYIVDYIVAETVGKLCAGKKPNDVAKLRVLDPACGSGSFLVGAYQFLLDWHRDWYLADGPGRHVKKIYQGHGGQWFLTTVEKKRILLNNIYGVDIDSQAVEVTKLSLLLKVLENENQESLERQLRLLHERALPDLGSNIKCGNSLVGPDYYDDKQILDNDEDEQLRINAFDWFAEFPKILHSRQQGFDAVIGNPPYVLLQSLGLPEVFSYLSRRYDSAKYKIDTYQVFFEQSIQLTAACGFVGLITPNTYLRNKHAKELRNQILTNTLVQSLQLHDFPVFGGASVDTCVTVAQRKNGLHRPRHVVSILRLVAPLESHAIGTCRQSDWRKREDLSFDLPQSSDGQGVLEKLQSTKFVLGDVATAYFGIQTFDRARFVSVNRRGSKWRPCIDGVNIGRYSLQPPSEFVCTDSIAIKSGGDAAVYESGRIGVRQIGQTPIATLVPGGWYSLNTIYNVFFTKDVGIDLRFVLGILSSKLLRWYWRATFFDQKRTFPKIKKSPLLAVPLPRIDMGISVDKLNHDTVVTLVRRLLDMNAKLQSMHPGHTKTVLDRQFKLVDRQLDDLVYEMFRLTPDERAVVEESEAASNVVDDALDS